MLDKFIFENHLGQKFDGLANGVFLNYSDLRDYLWSYDTINNRISRFFRDVTTRKIPLVVCGNSDAEAVAAKNRLHELAEIDVVEKIPGKIRSGDYYTTGYIVGVSRGEYLISKRYCTLDLTFVSDDPAWYQEKTHVFLPENEGTNAIGGGTDYPYDYPYDYAVSLKGRKIVCDSVGSSAFKMTIYGPATDPVVVIGTHTYAIKGSITAGEVLEIDGLHKTVTLTNAAGNKINWFDKRGRESYIFEPIPAGGNIVSWFGSFGFDLTIIEKRSEPKWT